MVRKKVESYIFDNGITSVLFVKNLPEEGKRYFLKHCMVLLRQL